MIGLPHIYLIENSVNINNRSSDDFNLSCGVLQGSCFTSVLLILYVSRLNQVIFQYSSNVDDNNTTIESYLKTIINYEIKEFSGINHSTRTLESKLYAHKGKVKGLTPTIIANIQKCFT